MYYKALFENVHRGTKIMADTIDTPYPMEVVQKFMKVVQIVPMFPGYKNGDNTYNKETLREYSMLIEKEEFNSNKFLSYMQDPEIDDAYIDEYFDFIQEFYD